MILNFYGDGAYAFLEHSIWNGLQLSDLAFPSFTFVMGVSIAITNRRDASRIKQYIYGPLPKCQGTPVWSRNHLKRSAFEFAKLIYRIWWRAVILFGIGITLSNLNSSNNKSLQICGVLQRLSLTYLITSLVTLPMLFQYSAYPTIEANAGSAVPPTVSSGIWRVSGPSGSPFSRWSRFRRASSSASTRPTGRQPVWPVWRTVRAGIWAPAASTGTGASRTAPEERTDWSTFTS